MIDSVAIVSGGLDSITLLHYLVKKHGLAPAVITFSYGQKHVKEIEYAKYHAQLLGCDQHILVDISFLQDVFSSSSLVSHQLAIPDIDLVQGDSQPSTYVPNRNMLFLALAAALAESKGVNDVYYGAQKHDLYGYWDTTTEFLFRLNHVFALNRKSSIQIKAPFVEFTKADIVQLGSQIDVDYSKTWSCYAGQDIACGKCPTCAERLNAFLQNGLMDPLPYATNDSPSNSS